LDSNFKALSKEDRQQRDVEHVKSMQRRTTHNEDNMTAMDMDNAMGDK
jgi:hypothetical protein